MEAFAKYDFAATAEDELSFRRGDVLHILQTDRDANWFNAETNGKVGFVPKNYLELAECSWYKGKLSRSQAEELLRSQPYDGAYVVRDSETQNEPGSYSLSVKHQDTVQHFKILKDQQYQYYIWTQKFASVNKLIEHHRQVTVSRQFSILLVDNAPHANTAGTRSARALYDFQPREEGELAFRKGDTIMVMDTNNSEWWKGSTGNNHVGYFPATYVEWI